MAKPIRANLVVQEGCITEYVWYNRAENHMIMQQGANESDEDFMKRKYPPVTVYKKKGEEDAYSVDQFGLKFAQKMSDFVSDNEELASKVRNKEKGYKMLNMLNIIDEYNAQCGE